MTRLSFTLILGAMLSSGHAADFSIEDESLRPVPAAVARALRVQIRGTDYKECARGKFIGALADLTGNGRNDGWIAKTADGCAWGAATAKIWILKKEQNEYRVVLYYGGQGVILQNSKTNGLRDLVIGSGTTGHYGETAFKFNGRQYKKSKSCAIDLQDPEESRRHPDGMCHVN